MFQFWHLNLLATCYFSSQRAGFASLCLCEHFGGLNSLSWCLWMGCVHELSWEWDQDGKTCLLSNALARQKWEQGSWSGMETEKKTKGLHKCSKNQFSMCVSTLWFTRCHCSFHPPYVAAIFRHFTPTVSVCLYAVLSLFPSVWVNVNASCCSSQTVPRETNQAHRRGNPLFCLKERGHGKRRKGLLFLCTPTSFLILTCRCVEGSSGLNHVVKLPGSTVQHERRRKEGMKSLSRKGGFLHINLGN